MRFAFTEEQLELRAAVRQVLARECTPGDLRAIAGPREAGPEAEADPGADPDTEADTEAEALATAAEAGGEGAGSSGAGNPVRGRSATRWAVLAEMGVIGLLISEAHGGLGLSEVELVGVLEEAGWAGVPEPLAETAALAAPLLAGAGRLAPDGAAVHALIERCLPAIAHGDLVAAVGGVDTATGAATCSTVQAGGDPPATAVSAGAAPGVDAPRGAGAGTTSGDGAGAGTTTGTTLGKGTVATVRVAGAVRAGLLLLATKAPATGWQIHAVDADTAWVTATPSIDGTRDLGTVEWIPSAQTLVASGRHAETLVGDLADRAAVASAAQLLGLAGRMITLAADYAKERKQFGKPIGSFQAVKHHLANARVRLEFARPATYRAADSLARGLPERSAHASMAKALASDAADLAARAALQVHGAIGYTWECDLHLFMKRAWALSAAWGDATTHRARVLSAAVARSGERLG